MNQNAKIPSHKYDFFIPVRSFWQHSRGRRGHGDFDLVMERDEDGLPMIAGRHLKGLLRLALRRAVDWEWLADTCDIDKLVGKGDHEGLLNIGSAYVAEPLRSKMMDSPEFLYRGISQTAVNESGASDRGSLRRTEVGVPLALVASISWLGDDTPREIIGTATAAFDEIGAKRTRGLGRVGNIPFHPVATKTGETK